MARIRRHNKHQLFVFSTIILIIIIVMNMFAFVFVGYAQEPQNKTNIIKTKYEIKLDKVPILLLNKEGAKYLCNTSSVPGDDYSKWLRKFTLYEVSGYVVVFSPEMELDAIYEKNKNNIIIYKNLTVYNVSVYYTRVVFNHSRSQGPILIEVALNESEILNLCNLDEYVFSSKYIYRYGVVPYVVTEEGLLFAGSGILRVEPGVLGNMSFVILGNWFSLLHYHTQEGLPREQRWIYTTLLLIGEPPARNYRYGNVSFLASETISEIILNPPRGREEYTEWYLTVYDPLVRSIVELIVEYSGGDYFELEFPMPHLGTNLSEYVARVDNFSEIPTQILPRLVRSGDYRVLYHAETGILIEFNVSTVNEGPGVLEGLLGWDFLLEYGSRKSIGGSNVDFADGPVDDNALARSWLNEGKKAHYMIRLVSVDAVVPRVEVSGERVVSGGFPWMVVGGVVGVVLVVLGVVWLRRRAAG